MGLGHVRTAIAWNRPPERPRGNRDLEARSLAGGRLGGSGTHAAAAGAPYRRLYWNGVFPPSVDLFARSARVLAVGGPGPVGRAGTVRMGRGQWWSVAACLFSYTGAASSGRCVKN